MKIFETQHRRLADEFTIKNEPIDSLGLMERAATAAFDLILQFYGNYSNFAIFAGIGNNGGDGLVVARHLKNIKKNVIVFVVEYSLNYSSDFKTNLERLKSLNVEIVYLKNNEQLNFDLSNFVVIDAIFGSGLSRPIEGIASDVIDFINNTQKQTVVSIDIPSGLKGEINDINNSKIIFANHTITFEYPFLSFLFAENDQFVGDFMVVPIGIHRDYISSTKTIYYLSEENEIKGLLKKRPKFGHKGTFGHSLLIAGSFGKMGAAVLSAKAAHRSGLGLLTAHIPLKCVDIMQIASPETLLSIDKCENFTTNILNIDKYTAIGVGPAIGFEQQTCEFLGYLLKNLGNKPIVLDADAITIIAQNPDLMSFLPKNAILTPHVKELERLIGKCTDSYERLQKQIEFSVKYEVIIVQKGAYTAISTPNGDVFFNNTGNNGLATGGSGDVLTGIILGLLSQGYKPIDAARLGVWGHGLAADIAAKSMSTISITPTDVINFLGKAFFYHDT